MQGHEVGNLSAGMNMVCFEFIPMRRGQVRKAESLLVVAWSLQIDGSIWTEILHDFPQTISMSVQTLFLCKPIAISQEIFSSSVIRSGFPDFWDICELKWYKRTSQNVREIIPRP